MGLEKATVGGWGTWRFYVTKSALDQFTRNRHQSILSRGIYPENRVAREEKLVNLPMADAASAASSTLTCTAKVRVLGTPVPPCPRA